MHKSLHTRKQSPSHSTNPTLKTTTTRLRPTKLKKNLKSPIIRSKISPKTTSSHQIHRNLHNKSPLIPIEVPPYATNSMIAQRRRQYAKSSSYNTSHTSLASPSSTLSNYTSQSHTHSLPIHSLNHQQTRHFITNKPKNFPNFAPHSTLSKKFKSPIPTHSSPTTSTSITSSALTLYTPNPPLMTLSTRDYRIHPSSNFKNPFETTPIHSRRNCWWRLTRDGREMGYVEFHLFDEYANNAVRFFRMLCRGDESNGHQAISLKGTYIHGIWPGNWLAGGDLIGTMGRAEKAPLVGGIYSIDILGMLNYKNNRPGLISFSSDGEYFGSIFRILYESSPWLDGTHCVFGEVIKGWDVLKEIENTRTNARSQPLVPIVIADCGECPY